MNRKRLAKLHQIYREVPQNNCTGQCLVACGLIAMSKAEYDHLTKISGEEPKFGPTGCNYLKDGKCKHYDDRPLICRLWGVTDDPLLKCEFCDAPKKLSKGEALTLLTKVRKLFNEEGFVDNA